MSGGLPRIITTTPPRTPPPMHSSSFISTSPTSYFSPSSPGTPSREIIMGGLVSRPSTPRESQIDEEWGMIDEKGSIEVPGIILTEPLPDLPPRSPSPPAKQILLLPPTSLPIPDPLSPSDNMGLASSSISAHRPFSPSFIAILHGRENGRLAIGGLTIKSCILLGAVILGGLHLWTSLCGDVNVEELVGRAHEN